MKHEEKFYSDDGVVFVDFYSSNGLCVRTETWFGSRYGTPLVAKYNQPYFTLKYAIEAYRFEYEQPAYSMANAPI